MKTLEQQFIDLIKEQFDLINQIPKQTKFNETFVDNVNTIIEKYEDLVIAESTTGDYQDISGVSKELLHTAWYNTERLVDYYEMI